MIASLNGTVCAIGLDYLVLEVSGIGYHVRTSPPTLTSVRHGQNAFLYTELVVREDSLTLYGFLTHEEADLFRTVQSVNGIGPRIALAVLAVMSPAEFAKAIVGEDIKTITSVPGIGPKGAKRMALELKERVAPFVTAEAAHAQVAGDDGGAAVSSGAVLNPHAEDVVKALVGLGWPEKSATTAVEDVLEVQEAEASGDTVADVDAAHLLRLALRQLGGRQ